MSNQLVVSVMIVEDIEMGEIVLAWAGSVLDSEIELASISRFMVLIIPVGLRLHVLWLCYNKI